MVHRPPALSVFDNLNAVAVLEVSDQALVAVQSSSMSVLTETAILIAMCKMQNASGRGGYPNRVRRGHGREHLVDYRWCESSRNIRTPS